MRRVISGGLATIFRGEWPGKTIKRDTEDRKIQKARRQAGRLKESGAVPWQEQIKLEHADGMHSRLETEMRKKEAKKAESGQLDKQMDASIKEE